MGRTGSTFRLCDLHGVVPSVNPCGARDCHRNADITVTGNTPGRVLSDELNLLLECSVLRRLTAPKGQNDAVELHHVAQPVI